MYVGTGGKLPGKPVNTFFRKYVCWSQEIWEYQLDSKEFSGKHRKGDSAVDLPAEC